MTTDVEAVRKRPAMYVGDVHDGSGLVHLIWEIVANSLDQHMAGRCRRIDVVLQHDGSAVIEDDGPGIPIIDVEGKPFAEIALTRWHETPTLDGHAPHEHPEGGGQSLDGSSCEDGHSNRLLVRDRQRKVTANEPSARSEWTSGRQSTKMACLATARDWRGSRHEPCRWYR